ncbi:hypothetical protein [Agrilutibacter solisilvae]|uniref:Uncharacterized protein n=1 Tax=Agrilutibacter solisilvae TaxID=2763317 RepID=A0A975ARP6_9GAMM|nr:hypothetical protein [Lysobacter solisilvae]QSX78109.1 hypothetical protein I8J32_015640 [Lysobacter solisilvae]
MEGWKNFFLAMDWKSVLVAGFAGTLLGAFLKEAAKDGYTRLSKRYFPSAGPEPEPAISKLTLAEVVELFKASPPLQRKHVEKGLVGVGVQWDLEFGSGTERFGTLSVTMGPEQKPGAPIVAVICDVPSKLYPQLQVLHSRKPVRVTGRIAAVTSMVITLSHAKLDIL